jgi:multidrug efflux pump subunit AcrA (membrane-fusion protein)
MKIIQHAQSVLDTSKAQVHKMGTTTKKIYKKKPKLFIVGLLVLAGAGYFMYTKIKDVESKETYVLARGQIEEAVQVTGKIKASTDADLSFEKGGTVSRIYVKEGQKVRAGAVLMELSGGIEYGSVLEARARVQSAQAQLDQLKNGARREEVAIKEAGLGSAQTTLDNAYASIGSIIKSSYNGVSDSVRYKTQSFFTGTASAGYRTSLSTCNSGLESEAANLRKQVEYDLVAWSKIDTTNMDQAAKEQALIQTENYINRASSLFETINSIVTAPCVAGDASLDAVRAAVSAARTSIVASQAEITAKKNTIASSKSAITISESDVTLTKAGTEIDKIKIQEAAVRQAYAALYQAQAQASKNVIVAPGNGVITKVDITTGEYASPGKSVVRLVGTGEYTVQADVTESDIARIVIGNESKILVTAIDSKTPFTGKVVSIDPAEQSSEGNPLYRIVISLDTTDKRIKSGMTAETTIVTSIVENLLRVPTRFVTKVKGVSKANVVTDTKRLTSEERDIVTGRRGTDGFVEVVSGLEEGEILVLPAILKK